MVKFAADNLRYTHDPESIQRYVEGQNLDIRRFLAKYESVVEGQRQQIRAAAPGHPQRGGAELVAARALISLTHDRRFVGEHLAAIHRLARRHPVGLLGGRDPLHEYLTTVHARFEELQASIAKKFPGAWKTPKAPVSTPRSVRHLDLPHTDQPFGSGASDHPRPAAKAADR